MTCVRGIRRAALRERTKADIGIEDDVHLNEGGGDSDDDNMDEGGQGHGEGPEDSEEDDEEDSDDDESDEEGHLRVN